MTGKLRSFSSLLLLSVLFGGGLAFPSLAQSTGSSAPQQKAFQTPQKAAESLVQAAETYDVPALLEIFGADGKSFVSSADPVRDKSIATEFAGKAHEKNLVTIDANDKTRAVLTVGKDDWPFPVPIVKKRGKWYFDAKQGREEILFRRIGSNELDAIQV